MPYQITATHIPPMEDSVLPVEVGGNQQTTRIKIGEHEYHFSNTDALQLIEAIDRVANQRRLDKTLRELDFDAIVAEP